MSFITNLIKSFRKTDKKDSQQLYEDLDSGKSIEWQPRSDRYTYKRDADYDYDKDWTPQTEIEKQTLAPDGFFRVKDRKDERRSIVRDLTEKYIERAKEEKEKLSPADYKEANIKANQEFARDEKEKTVSIDSTALSKVKYDPKTEGLKVQFQGNPKEYFYPAVPLEKIENMMKAPSKGEYFLENIHDQHTMNPGHRPAGSSRSYGDMNKAQVSKFFKKYSKGYSKKNKNDGWKKRLKKYKEKANKKYGSKL